MITASGTITTASATSGRLRRSSTAAASSATHPPINQYGSLREPLSAMTRNDRPAHSPRSPARRHVTLRRYRPTASPQYCRKSVVVGIDDPERHQGEVGYGLAAQPGQQEVDGLAAHLLLVLAYMQVRRTGDRVPGRVEA